MQNRVFLIISLLVLIAGIISISIFKTTPAQKIPTKNEYNRIVSMSPHVTETLFALNLGKKLVGVTRFCKYPPEAEQIAKVGGYLDPNYEAIAALEPDLVILLPEQERIEHFIRKLGDGTHSIETQTVDNKTVTDILNTIRTLGSKCGADSLAQLLVQDLKNRIQKIKNRTENLSKPSVLISIGRPLGEGTLKDVYIAGKNSSFDELLTIAGAQNAYQDAKLTYPMLTAEGILHLNPDIILDMVADLKDREEEKAAVLGDWQAVSHVNAVKNDRLFLLTEDYIMIPGPRFILLLEDLVQIIHPEIEF